MKKVILAAMVAVAGIASAPAHAALVDINLGSGDSTSFGSGGTLTANTNIANLGGNLTGSDYVVVNPSSSSAGNYAAPTGTVYDNNYLAVEGVPTSGVANVAIASPSNVFGFTWGSIDSYNTLVVNATNGTYTITGSQLLADIVGSVAGTTQSDVKLVDASGTITSVAFESSQNSFEVANIQESSVSAVPLPGALPMFLTALAAVGLFAFRRNNKAI